LLTKLSLGAYPLLLMAGPGTYEVKRLSEMERAFGGALARVRAELGISAFGVQVVDLPPNSGQLAPEHDHEHDSQEELYLLLSGSAEVVVPDGVISLDPETFVRLGPAVRRRVRSGPEGARLLMVGGTPGRAYVAPANTELGGPETLGPTASSAIAPDGPPPQLPH
jgi:mannose-6-phosphate isomerase-like protein (cupin superfamily)